MKIGKHTNLADYFTEGDYVTPKSDYRVGANTNVQLFDMPGNFKYRGVYRLKFFKYAHSNLVELTDAETGEDVQVGSAQKLFNIRRFHLCDEKGNMLESIDE